MRARVFLWRVLLMAPVSLVCTLVAASAAGPFPRWRPELMCLAVAASVVVCVPRRTRSGQAWHPIMRTMQRMPQVPVYPIGTAWWGEETQRAG